MTRPKSSGLLADRGSCLSPWGCCGRVMGCLSDLCERARSSRRTAVVVMFIAFMLDLMLLTVVEPVLPDIIRSITGDNLPNGFNQSQTAEWTRDKLAGNLSDDYGDVDPVLVGFLNGAKPLTQVVLNPIIGCIVDRVSDTVPMMVGFIVALVSTVGFAYANSIWLLMVTRSVQGIGSSLMTIAGLSMLANVYKEPEERGKAMAVAFSGLAFGLIIGYPFGSIVYQFAGRQVPFLVLAAFILLGAVIRFTLMPVWITSEGTAKTGESQCEAFVCCDPYILVAAGVYFWECYGVGAVMGIGPLMFLGKLGAQQWQIGVIFLVGAISQNIVQYVVSYWAYNLGWWLISMVGLFFVGVGVGLFGAVSSLWVIFVPQTIYAAGLGMVMGSVPPMLGDLADIRVNSQYGSVYALSDTGTNLGYFLGSTVTGLLVARTSYLVSFCVAGILIFLFGFLCFLLKRVPSKMPPISIEERKALLKRSWRRTSSVSYNYKAI